MSLPLSLKKFQKSSSGQYDVLSQMGTLYLFSNTTVSATFIEKFLMYVAAMKKRRA